MGHPEELLNGECQNQTVELIQSHNEDDRPCQERLTIPSEDETSQMQDIDVVGDRKGRLDGPRVRLMD